MLVAATFAIETPITVEVLPAGQVYVTVPAVPIALSKLFLKKFAILFYYI
jgi:hypothetical protein